MAKLRLNDALKIMDNGEVFSIEYVTFDKKRKTGGRIKYYPEAKLLKSAKSTISGSTKSTSIKAKKSTNPNHWDNATRNIKILIDGVETSGNKKLHIFLILKLNGKRVYL